MLFVLATYKLPAWLPADAYLRLDPLLGLSALLAAKEMIPRVLWALVLVGGTLLVGRFFCGWVCPLGAALDVLDVIFRRRNRPWLRREAALRQVKYGLLVLCLVASLAGLSLAYLVDPLALLTRFYAFVLYPLAITLLNLGLDVVRPALHAAGWVGLSHLHYPQPVYYMALVTFLIFGGVIALNRFAPRFWCRYLCLLGALLNLLSPLGLFRRAVDKGCDACLECQPACPMGALGDDPAQTRMAECIQCRTCAEACPTGAIGFPAFAGAANAPGRAGEYAAPEVSRRAFVASATGGVAAAFLVDRTPFAALQDKRHLIRPRARSPKPSSCARASAAGSA